MENPSSTFKRTPLQQLRTDVNRVLEMVKGRLKPGMRLTLIARHPDPAMKDCYIIFSDDDQRAVIETLRHDAQRQDVENLMRPKKDN